MPGDSNPPHLGTSGIPRSSRGSCATGSTLRNVGAGWQGVPQHPRVRSPPAPSRGDETMSTDSRAGTPATAADLVDVEKLLRAYHDGHPDPGNPAQAVAFGTSGHRGSSLLTTFNDDHIAATTQAIVEYRAREGTDGPLFIGADTHALSGPAWETCVEVLAANGVTVLVDSAGGYTPTPAVSHAILAHNHSRAAGLADGIVITPSHNPPQDGGFKYNPPNGGPADTDATKWIAGRANELLAAKLDGVQRRSLDAVRGDLGKYDFMGAYVADLPAVVNLDAIRSAGVRIGADPMGGASVAYWGAIAERHGLDLTVVNPEVDPQFGFMTLDWDGKIRMDCSSPYAMASLVARRAEYQIATGNDADIGKTAVSSSMIDLVAHDLGRRLVETPVGFKWFVPGLIDSSIGFGGEESAGASFLRTDGTVWTTDKDGFILDLLAAEITARTGRDPGEHSRELEERFGRPFYARIDAPANRAQKAALAALSPEQVSADTLAGDPILRKLTT